MEKARTMNPNEVAIRAMKQHQKSFMSGASLAWDWDEFIFPPWG
jgi:hypothetical protein